MKKYHRWPRNEEALQKRIKRICHDINEILIKDFPYEIIRKESGQELYREKFKELFLQTGYKYDPNPKILFSYGSICCSPTVRWSFSILSPSGKNMSC